MKYNKYVVSENIKTLRAKKGITAFELSEALDCSISHISQIEQGRRKMSVELLCKLTDFFNTDANSILGMNHRSDQKDDSEKANTSQSDVHTKMTHINEMFATLSPSIQEYLANNFQHMIEETVQLQKSL